MYTEDDLQEAFTLGYKEASNSYDSYDLQAAFELGYKEANIPLNSFISTTSKNVAKAAPGKAVRPPTYRKDPIIVSKKFTQNPSHSRKSVSTRIDSDYSVKDYTSVLENTPKVAPGKATPESRERNKLRREKSISKRTLFK